MADRVSLVRVTPGRVVSRRPGRWRHCRACDDERLRARREPVAGGNGGRRQRLPAQDLQPDDARSRREGVEPAEVSEATDDDPSRPRCRNDRRL